MISALAFPIVALLFAASVAQAQPTDAIKVHLNGTCTIPEHAFLVINHDENKARRITLNAEGDWQGTWPGLPANSSASLYLSGARTWCRISKVVEGDKSEPIVALFTFSCSEQPTRDEEIETTPPVDFTYCRQMGKDDSSHDGLDRELEEVFHGRQTKTIPDWRFPDERIRLRLNTTTPKCDAQGLFLNDLDFVKKNVEGSVPLSPDDLDQACGLQRASGGTGRPSSGPNACELAHKEFHDLTVILTKVKGK